MNASTPSLLFRPTARALPVGMALGLGVLASTVLAQVTDPAPGRIQKPPGQARPASSPTSGAPLPMEARAAKEKNAEQSKPGSVDAFSPASTAMEKHTDNELIGRNIRSSDDKKLGEIEDLLVDPHSGEIAYALVSSGGFHKRHRLAPFTALGANRAEKDDTFLLGIDEATWEHLTPLSDEQVKAGRIVITDTERSRLDRLFGSKPVGIDLAAFSGPSSYLLRTSDIRGRKVRAGDQSIGEIDSVLINTKDGKALALFDPADRFMEAPRFMSRNDKYVVPLDRFSFGAERSGEAMSTLARNDFAPVAHSAEKTIPAPPPPGTGRIALDQPPQVKMEKTPVAPPEPTPAANSEKAASAPAQKSEKPVVASREAKASGGDSHTGPSAPSGQPSTSALTPTGKTSADQTPAASPALVQAAQGIRSALDQDAQLARAGVQVAPENDRIVLRGSVADENIKKSIEAAAGKAGQGAKIDSQIAVKHK